MTETGNDAPRAAVGAGEPGAPVPAETAPGAAPPAERGADLVRVDAEERKRNTDLREKTLEFERESAQRRHTLALRVFTWGGGFIALLLAVSLAFVFLGSEPQSAYARELLRSLGIALAGGGAIQMVVQALRWLFGR